MTVADNHEQTEKTGELAEQSIMERIAVEAKELKAYAEAFGMDRFKDGSWFTDFIGVMLKSYSENIIANGGVEFYRKKYPGLPIDQIADKLIELAENYAALSGGVTALGATASEIVAGVTAATVVTTAAGYAAVVGSIGVDILFTARLQLRLIYDLSVLYGYPIDTEDPDDLMRAFSMAYGVAVASAGSEVITKVGGPEVIRHQIKSLLRGNIKLIQKVATKIVGSDIGKKITQRSLVKGLVPGVSVILSSGWNYVATKRIAAIAKHELRSQARIRNAVRELAEVLTSRIDYAPLVLESIIAVATSDGVFERHEQELFNTVVAFLNLPEETLGEVERQIEVSENAVVKKFETITGDEFKAALAECLLLVAAADGKVHKAEELLLSRLFSAMGVELDKAALSARAEFFKLPTFFMDSAGEAIGAAADSVMETLGNAGNSISAAADNAMESLGNAGNSIKAFFTTSTPKDGKSSEAGPAAIKEIDPVSEIRKLAVLLSEGILTNEEFTVKKAELLARI